MDAPNAGSPSLGRLRISRAAGSIGAGKYLVFGNLGRGGMAEIQLGAAQGPKGFSKLVVVKRLRAALADDLGVVNMFMDEARLAARLNNPKVVNTYEFGEEHGSYFIVMEYLDGQALNEVLQGVAASRTKVPPALWARVLADALAGLHYAHELRDYDGTPLNVVHRDVSPQNIVVTYDGRVKLVDFGIAKATLNVAKTESQIIKGKLAYMAPEQAAPRFGVALDRRADIFAMGIVLWECLAGTRLITGDVRSALTKIVDMDFEPPSKVNPDVPPELDEITLRALERSPDKRYQTAEEMREALEGFLRAKGEFVGEKGRSAPSSPASSLRSERTRGGRSASTCRRSRRPRAILLREETRDGAAPSGSRVPESGPTSGVESPAGFSITESVQSLRAVRKSTPHAGEARGGWAARTGATAAILLAFGVAVIGLVAVRAGTPPVSALDPAPPRAAARAPRALTRLTVRVEPEGAVVSFDNAPVTNPFVGTFERDEVEHRLKVTCTGYAPATKLVRLDRDEVTQDVKLDKLDGAPALGATPAPASSAKASPAKRPTAPPRLDADPWR